LWEFTSILAQIWRRNGRLPTTRKRPFVYDNKGENEVAKRLTLKELSNYLEKFFVDFENHNFDTESAIKFLYDFGFLNLEKIQEIMEDDNVD
jgi:hypothetical protein